MSKSVWNTLIKKTLLHELFSLIQVSIFKKTVNLLWFQMKLLWWNSIVTDRRPWCTCGTLALLLRIKYLCYHSPLQSIYIHTHTYIMYVHICMYICVCVCMCTSLKATRMCVYTHSHLSSISWKKRQKMLSNLYMVT